MHDQNQQRKTRPASGMSRGAKTTKLLAKPVSQIVEFAQNVHVSERTLCGHKVGEIFSCFPLIDLLVTVLLDNSRSHVLPRAVGSCRTLGGAGRCTGSGERRASPAAPGCSRRSSAPPDPGGPERSRQSPSYSSHLHPAVKCNFARLEVSASRRFKVAWRLRLSKDGTQGCVRLIISLLFPSRIFN